MPAITRPDGSLAVGSDAEAVITALGLTVTTGVPPGSDALAELLADHRLDPARCRAILDEVETGDGFAGSDVVALFPDTPGLHGILDAFRRPHRHADDEIRMILAGSGVFGFALPDGDQVEISVTAGDSVHVPAGTEHWFRLTEARTLVAIRLFGATPDWRAEYTDTPVQFPL